MTKLYRRLYVRVVCSREFYWSSSQVKDSKIVCKKHIRIFLFASFLINIMGDAFISLGCTL